MSIIRNVTLEAFKYIDNDDILICIGARQTGKTTILRQIQKYLEKENSSVYFLNLEDPDYLSLLNQSPKNLLKLFSFDLTKKSYVIIDEVQYLDNPSNFLKYFYDEYKGKIKLIVSGSSAFYIDRKFNDSLVGRKKLFYVRTLSFKEFLRFKNENDLSNKDFRNLSIHEKEKISLLYHEYMLYGGYPKVVLSDFDQKIDLLMDIAYSYIKKDIYEANIKSDEVFYKLCKILASQIGGLVNTSEIANTLGVSKTAIDNYLYILQKSFHIALVRPFYMNARKELTKMPKCYYMDMGLRNFFVSSFESFKTRKDNGQLLENASFRQLLDSNIYENIKFWRTVQGNEVDFIVNDKIAYEVKVDESQFKKNKYSVFMQIYNFIPMAIVTVDKKLDMVEGFSVYDVWEI
jgi:predicted AAA+ superfamily ATPase